MGLLINRRRDYQRYPSPLRLTALEPTSFTFTMSMDPTALQFIEYSLDNGITWVRTMNETTDVVVEIPEIAEGESVLLRGEGFKTDPPTATGVIASTGKFAASGDILGLINKVELEQTNKYTAAFRYLFRNSKIVDASHLELPYILSYSCFQGLFYDCAELLYPPKLLAHHLTNSCYYAMFRGCTKLAIAPELPATILATGCYQQMFHSCTSLVNAPDLPAERLVSNCYHSMFYVCTSLKYIKCMTLDALSASFNGAWVYGVRAGGTFVKNSAADWEDTYGANAIPTGWTVEITDKQS